MNQFTLEPDHERRANFSVIFSLIKDTFRQSLASGICWLLTGLSTICILVCLSVKRHGPQSPAAPGENRNFLPHFDKTLMTRTS